MAASLKRKYKMPPSHFVIRPASAADASLAADLIYLTMGIEADWLFGQVPGISTHTVLSRLFRRNKNRVAHSFAFIAAHNGQDVGLLLAYPGRLLKRLDWMTGLHLLGIFGLPATLRVAQIQSAYQDLIEAEEDEFYISNVAVLPQFQGHGAGKALMAYAEQLAQENNLKKCSLIVAHGHEPARRLYMHLGYQVVQTFHFDHPYVAEGSGGYDRMVKVLAERP
jgi:ribosomal protein S18 acetylase RimI-like enzyme